jgi:hypothetical protein
VRALRSSGIPNEVIERAMKAGVTKVDWYAGRCDA